MQNRIINTLARWAAIKAAERDARAATRTRNHLREVAKAERREARRAERRALARRLYAAWLDRENPGYGRQAGELLLLPAPTRVNVEKIREVIGGIRLERRAA